MTYKNPDRQREYQRQWQRARRAGDGVKFKVLQLSTTPKEIKTASALLGILTGLIKEVLETDQGDIFMKARAAGYLISIGLKAVEVAGLESRLSALENKVMGSEK